jgi:hypothetical protein
MIPEGPITADIKIGALESWIWSKQTWLESFSHGRGKRPDHEIAQKQREIAVLLAIKADYEAKAIGAGAARQGDLFAAGAGE